MEAKRRNNGLPRLKLLLSGRQKDAGDVAGDYLRGLAQDIRQVL